MENVITIIHPTRSDTKDADGRFLFQTRVGEAIFTYLTTDPKTQTSEEKWKNNFSTFFDIGDGAGETIGILGLSIDGISLFDAGYANRRDIELRRTSDEYRRMERIERAIRANENIATIEDIEFLSTLWATHYTNNFEKTTA